MKYLINRALYVTQKTCAILSCHMHFKLNVDYTEYTENS